ncbi:TetR/AcrR family transcriptional regulator [Actinomadura scrupuli]|uniref:TetR/AcrR family transcriptional regulator n=1 Tax=Actinomadura scrupuli TaxID=559629 RepID=UPI003D961D2A
MAAQTGGRSRVRKDHDERREQILECARVLFRDRSYETVSNTEIAAAAGVSRGLLNHYFGTKRELYLAAVEQLLNVPPIPVPPYVEGASARDRVGQSLDGWLELLERNSETWLAAMDRMGAGGDPQLGLLLDEAREKAVDHITEVVGLRPAAHDHPEVRAVLRAFSGMAEATSQEWLRRRRLTRAQVRTLLEETLLHLIGEVLPQVIESPETSPPAEH